MQELEGMTPEDLRHTVVSVLVDDDDPKPGIVLSLQRIEESIELECAVDRRDDEVERRGGLRHGP